MMASTKRHIQEEEEEEEEEEILILAAGILAASNEDTRIRNRKQRSVWTRRWLLRRPLYGQYEQLMVELAAEDQAAFKNFQRVDPEMFAELLDRIAPRIQRQNTNMRQALSPGLRLAVTLRYLASGNSYMSLQYGFRIANNTISKIIPEVCEAIISEYENELMSCPTEPTKWKEVAEGFSSRWNFHNTIGALDGKHIALKCPPGTGSMYYNYKGFYSIVLMALVDSDYKFIYVDLGANGRYVLQVYCKSIFKYYYQDLNKM
jgi:hypothetical protein